MRDLKVIVFLAVCLSAHMPFKAGAGQDGGVSPAMLRPDHISGEIDRAKNLVNDQRCDEAMPLLEKIIAADPTNVEAYLGRAVCFYDRKEFHRAMMDYDKALELNPDQKDIYLLLASVYRAEKKYSQSQDMLRKYLGYFPQDGEAWYSLAWMTKDMADLDRAEDLGYKDSMGLRKVIQNSRFEKIKGAHKPQNDLFRMIFGLGIIFCVALMKIFITPTSGKVITDDEIKRSFENLRSVAVAIFIGATIFNVIFIGSMSIVAIRPENQWGLMSFSSMLKLALYVYIFCALLVGFLYAAVMIAVSKLRKP